MCKSEKNCCLTLDEMCIQESITFDPSNGKVIGYSDLPGTDGIATHALVFMLGGR